LDGGELVDHEQGGGAGVLAGHGEVADVGQQDPQAGVGVQAGDHAGHGDDGQVAVLIGPGAVEGWAEGGDEVGDAELDVGELVLEALDEERLGPASLPDPLQGAMVEPGDELVSRLAGLAWLAEGQAEGDGGDLAVVGGLRGPVPHLDKPVDDRLGAATPDIERFLGEQAHAGVGPGG
jgi:hypothetical protein